jgi:hypothetical protein
MPFENTEFDADIKVAKKIVKSNPKKIFLKSY